MLVDVLVGGRVSRPATPSKVRIVNLFLSFGPRHLDGGDAHEIRPGRQLSVVEAGCKLDTGQRQGDGKGGKSEFSSRYASHAGRLSKK